jgi:uncharacterized protein (TIGR01370 family)
LRAPAVAGTYLAALGVAGAIAAAVFGGGDSSAIAAASGHTAWLPAAARGAGPPAAAPAPASPTAPPAPATSSPTALPTLAPSTTPEPTREAAFSLADVSAWALQTRALAAPGAISTLEAAPYEMYVLDPTRTDWSSANRRFDTAAMTAQLQAARRTGQRRPLVLAYVDLARAEDTRWYWRWSHPRDCDRPPDWPPFLLGCAGETAGGRYAVAYWDPAWRQLMLDGVEEPRAPDRDYASVLDEVLRDGFDGVVLGGVEMAADPLVAAAAARDRVDPAAAMAALIASVAEYGRARRDGFLVVQLNGADLLGLRPDVAASLDAVAHERVWFDGTLTDRWDHPDGTDRLTPPDLSAAYKASLATYQAAGLPVFVCEYALLFADEAYDRAAHEGYVAYVTRRALSRLTTTPPWR